jgi:hypothetical protein
VHTIEYTWVARMGPVLCTPLLANVPLQSPEAAQEVAEMELQVNVDALPAGTAVGIAVNWEVGAALTVIMIVAG